MYKNILLTALLGLTLTACERTERKVIHPRHSGQTQTEQTQTPEAPAEGGQTEQAPAQPQSGQDAPVPTLPAEPATTPDTPPAEATTPTQTEQTPPTPAQPAVYSDCLMEVHSVTQGFNVLRPWEKVPPSRSVQSAVYLGKDANGNGRVLVCGAPLRAATYVELRLPDGSRTAPARIVKYDADLGLGLLTVAHEEDAGIFDTRKAYPVGEPLRLGDEAEIWTVINGTMPSRVKLHAESGREMHGMPFMNLKAERAIAGEIFANGAPIIREGKLVGISQGYEQAAQRLTCINAEIITRFLEEDSADAAAGCPLLGVSFELLQDPVFRRYLRMDDSWTGLYISMVKPMGAAASAGIKEGDVLVAVEGMPVDSQGRCNHTIYGPISASCIAHSIKPLGGKLHVAIAREGQILELDVPLDTTARDNDLIGTDKPGVQPRYILWGGLLFQTLTHEYMQAVRSVAGSLPVQLLEIDRRTDALREEGVTELVVLSGAIPTPATLGYEQIGCCVVEKVNGKRIHNFREFEEALDEPTKDGIVEISINCAPYTIYVDVQMAQAANDALQRNSFHVLRHTGTEQ